MNLAEREKRVTPSSVHPGTHSGEDHVREEKGSLEMRWLSQSIVSLRLLIISVNLTGCRDVWNFGKHAEGWMSLQIRSLSRVWSNLLFTHTVFQLVAVSPCALNLVLTSLMMRIAQIYTLRLRLLSSELDMEAGEVSTETGPPAH